MTIPIEQMAVKWSGRPTLLTPRTLNNTISDMSFNVKDFGAKGDTTNFLDGTDDTAAIQLAVNAAGNTGTASAAGAEVYFPAGMYKVSGPINFIKGAQVCLRGMPLLGTAIGGFFPDYIINNPLTGNTGLDGNGSTFVSGAGLGSISNISFSNAYINYLTSCTYTSPSGTASCLTATCTGTTLTLHDHPGSCTNATIADVGTSPVVHTLTLTGGVITGSFVVGQLVTGVGVTAGSIITGVLSGSGGAGSTYSGITVNTTGIIGTFGIGQRVVGTGFQPNTIICVVLSGSGGANSTYQINLGATVSVETPISSIESGVVTFGITNSPYVGHTIQIGDYFHVFGTYPRPYNSRYVACTGTTGTTLVGGGGIVSSNNFAGGDPGTVTMLGCVGGGCVRTDYCVHTFIEKCNFSGVNGLHAGGGTGYGIIGNGAYNCFGLSVRDTGFTSGFSNGEYGTVGAFCGEADFYNCSVFSYDKGIVQSGNGFGFSYGQIETDNCGIVLGLDDQLFPATAGASVIMANHTEDVDIAVDIVGCNNLLMVSNQWASNCAGRGGHVPFYINGTTTSGSATITAIPTIVITGDTTIHSPRITNLSASVSGYEGMAISGAGIPAGSEILTSDAGGTGLTFINTAGGTGNSWNGDPLGASATGSGITITLTVNAGMRVDPFSKQSGSIPGATAIISTTTPSAGVYTALMTNAATASNTISIGYFTGCTYTVRVGGLQSGEFIGNSIGGPNRYAAVGIGHSNCSYTCFIGNQASSNGGSGVDWEVVTYPNSQSAAGITYIGNNNPDMSFDFQSLPGQPGQTLGHADMQGDMEFSIRDSSNTSTMLAITGPSGVTPTVGSHRRIRSTPRLACTITRSGSTATVTTAVAHGLTGNQVLTITGALNDDYGSVSRHYNGSYVCDCTVAVNQFSYTCSVSPTPPPTPATGNITYAYWIVVG
jgi:hypothetical protein